jgi:polysaccharide export outer membrane protein
MRIRNMLILQIILGLGSTHLVLPQTLTQRDQRYLLRPGDVISVEYRYTPEYNSIVSIQPDGFTELPLLGDVKLGGLSLDQVHDALMAKAGERLNSPEITIGLKEFDKPHYIVGGEVGTPGRYEIHGPVTALQAVEIAGGFKSSAKSSQILLIRPVNGSEGETKLINLKTVLDQRHLEEDIELRPGDMLLVPRNRLSKVEPYVRLVNAGFYLNPLSF